MDLKFKILNKSKDGIVVDLQKRGKVKFTWEKFNQKFIIKDDYAEFNESEKLRIEQYKLEKKTQAKLKKENLVAYSTGKNKNTLMSSKGYEEFYNKFILKNE